MMEFARAIPPIAWLGTLPQLISRIGHQHLDVTGVLQALLRSCLEHFPQQALWAQACLMRTANKTRRHGGARHVGFLTPYTCIALAHTLACGTQLMSQPHLNLGMLGAAGRHMRLMSSIRSACALRAGALPSQSWSRPSRRAMMCGCWYRSSWTSQMPSSG